MPTHYSKHNLNHTWPGKAAKKIAVRNSSYIKEGLVCFDEWLKQSIEETRIGKPAKPGHVERYDYEYKRNCVRKLNMAEIELSVFARRLKAFIPDDETLSIEVNALVGDRNHSTATVNWQFRTDDAGIKLKRLYPSLSD